MRRLGFLGGLPRAFAPLLLAHGALLAGMFADGIFFAGMTLPQYKVELVAVLILVVFFVVGPLMVFMPVLARAKRAGLREYGMFAQRYVQAFDRKWLRGKRADDERLGSADIQSLADLGNSFAIVRGMRMVPIDKTTLIGLAIPAVLPMAPVLILGTPADQLIRTVLNLLA